VAGDFAPFALSLSKGFSRSALCFDKLGTNGKYYPVSGGLS
tara:strand:- start:3740 stop:3862 length:123 start_codon:yes stop_codon:yes gene_type:complete